VLVDIPRDIQQQTCEFEYPDSVNLPGYKPETELDLHQIKRAAALIDEATKPVILSGHGVVISHAWDEMVALAEKTQTPVITTLLGLGGFPGTHPLNMGMPGMHGMFWNNQAISEADLIIGVGMRFDDRVTGRLKDFAPNAKIIHIDIDPAEIGKNLPTAVPIVGDVKQVLNQLNAVVGSGRHDQWISWIRDLKEQHPSIVVPETDKVLPQYVIKSIYDASGADAYYVTGVGQHQMWAAQYFWIDKPSGFITSGGLGTMGFEVPAALGAQMADKKSTVWSICGDGGFQMTLQELATIVEYQLPVKFAIINNGFLGMVRQWQGMFYNNNLSAVRMYQPDFVKLAEAFGMKAMRVTDKAQVQKTIDDALNHAGPVLIDFQVEEYENTYPMVPPGASLQETVDSPYKAGADTTTRNRELAGGAR
jgi:acetolactate synthase-1/2/3 large subunit